MATVLRNAMFASLLPRQMQSGSISIDGDRIAAVGDVTAGPEDHVVDLSGRLVIPGNVCAHTHLYSALARGMPGPPRQPRNFVEILQLVWWRLDRALDAASTRSSGLVGALDAVRAGTTTLIDHHASPNFIDGSLDVLADAIDEIGLRAVLCYEVTDRDGRERRDAGLRENERFLKNNRRDRIRGVVGAHASFTLDDESLDRLSGLAADFDTGVHIHVAEDLVDETDSLQRCGDRTAVRLKEFGILRDHSIAAHGVHLSQEEIGAIGNAGTWLVHNCRSNLNNSVGRAPVLQFGRASALGTDGIDEDMFAESRTAFFRAREDSLDVSADLFANMLARGAELAGAWFPPGLGAIESGKLADLVVLDYDPPTPLSEGNLAWHWMFALTASNVESVMVGGRWVLRHGEFCLVDEEKIRAEARQQAAQLWTRMEAL